MSFIKIINSRGPRTYPCGTPYLIIFLDDRVLSIRVIIFLFLRYLLINKFVSPLNTIYSNLASKIS